MSDRLFLSLWLNRYSHEAVLAALKKLLEAFPYSSVRPGIAEVSVRPIDWGEPDSLDQEYAAGAEVDFAMGALAEFAHPDCAYTVDVFWDLEGAPSRVQIIAYGPEFEGRDEERGHIEIDLGVKTPFVFSRANLARLIALSKDLAARLPLQKRRLWTESGEDFAQTVAQSIQ